MENKIIAPRLPVTGGELLMTAGELTLAAALYLSDLTALACFMAGLTMGCFMARRNSPLHVLRWVAAHKSRGSDGAGNP